MNTTIKVTKETKERLASLSIADKSKTFDMLINELISYHNKDSKSKKKDYTEWRKQYKAWEKNNEVYLKEKDSHLKKWNSLLKWAKSQGFKG